MSISNFNIIELLRKIALQHKNKELGFINHQRQSIILCYAIAISLGAISNICKFSGSFEWFFTITNSVMLALFFIVSTLYTANILDIKHTGALLTLTCQIAIATDNIYCAFTPSLPHYRMVILMNLLILLGNTLINLATYLPHIAQVTASIAIISYTVCVLVSGDETLKDYYFMILIIFALTCFLGFRVTKVAHRLQEENQTLKRDEDDLLNILRINKKQVKAYLKLAKHNLSEDETSAMLNMLDETAQTTLINNVSNYIQHQETDEAILEKTFPDFTPSEIKICQLILRNKKQSEICSILNKTESNISTQRANIRKKLSLQPTENLHKALIQRLRGGFESQV